ncbi:hypothetical protein ACQZV8_08125 [Magnetococcales bacterium HHB-1]
MIKWFQNLITKTGATFTIILLFLLIGSGVYYHIMQINHETLNTALKQQPQRTHIIKINSSLLNIRRDTKNFILYRQDTTKDEIYHHLDTLTMAINRYTHKEKHHNKESADKIKAVIPQYRAAFQSFIASWQVKGMDHQSRLQSVLHDAAQRLEQKLRDFDTTQLQIIFGDLRYHEQSFQIDHQPHHLEAINKYIKAFHKHLIKTEVSPELAQKLTQAITHYQTVINPLSSQRALNRQALDTAAANVESLLDDHYIPQIWHQYLTLKRYETNYQLHEVPSYAHPVHEELNRIQQAILKSTLTVKRQQTLLTPLKDYREAFNLLLQQDKKQQQDKKNLEQIAEQLERQIDIFINAPPQMQKNSASQYTPHPEDHTTSLSNPLFIGAIFMAIALLMFMIHSILKIRHRAKSRFTPLQSATIQRE